MLLVQDEPNIMSELIEINIPAGSQRVQLPDVQQLRSQEGQIIIIKSFQLITAKVLSNGVLIQGTNAPVTELRKMTLTLYSEGWERGHLIPLLFFNDVADGDTTAATTIPYRNKMYTLDNWRKVDFPKSYIQFCNGTAPVGAPYLVLLQANYLKLDGNQQPYVTP